MITVALICSNPYIHRRAELPGVPRIGDVVRFYTDEGPYVRNVREIIWDEKTRLAEVRLG